ncbi:DUF6602 domain-containing protein [Candidatus Neomarinimicrobiota bacterium]
MSVFDEWSKYIVGVLKSESDLAGSLMRHGGELGDAREALIKGVLSRILPSIYDIGTGEIIDSENNYSKQVDIVISRSDSPTLTLPSGSRVFLIESVLAAIEVKSRIGSTNLRDALDNCASVTALRPRYKVDSVKSLAERYGVKIDDEGNTECKDKLNHARFECLVKPTTYIYGFTGYKASSTSLKKAMLKWGKSREEMEPLKMYHLPAVIAGEGCYGLRHVAPIEIPRNRYAYFIGRDSTPLRLLVMHLLFTLQRKIPVSPDENGLIPATDVYQRQMAPLTTDHQLFEVRDVNL